MHTQRPRLSVLIPNYNHGKYIGRALEAVIHQSQPPDELLVVDDGSTDDSVSIIRQYALRYPWITFIAHGVNQGVEKMLVDYVPRLRGEYVYFGAADDRVLPGFFAAALRAAADSPRAGIIFGQIIAETEAEQPLYTIAVRAWRQSLFASPEQFRRECLDREAAGQSLVGSTVFRAEAFRAVGGFRPEFGSWCDSFAWRAAGARYGACYLAFPCMAWTIHPRSISHVASRRPRHMLRIVRQAAALMRSSEFRRDFPEKHVRHWQRGYYLIIAEQYILSWFPAAWLAWLSRRKFLRTLRAQWLRLFS